MDASSYTALSLALDLNLPSVLEDARLEIERTRMEREDLAARGIQGRFAANCNLCPELNSAYWIQSFHYVNNEWFALMRRQRRAMRQLASATTMSEVAVARDILAESDDGEDSTMDSEGGEL